MSPLVAVAMMRLPRGAMNYWITTHWPLPESDTDFSRHVYVKQRHVTVPQGGDVVFVREARSVKGAVSPTVYRCHKGVRTAMTLPPGFGGIIGKLTVEGTHRPINERDVVYDYGDLPEWSIIECRDFTPVRLPLADLLAAIGKAPDTGLQFLNLWRVPDEHVPALLGAIERAAGGGAAPRTHGLPLWHRAAAVAARFHHGQMRKDGRTPYIAHPFRVAMIVRDVFEVDDGTAVAAALLHDVIEDTTADYDDLRAEFGKEVADVVAALTKDMRRPEDQRELEYDAQLVSAPWQARLVKLADVYDNVADCMNADIRVKALKKAERALALAGTDARLRRAVEKVAELVTAQEA